MHQPAAALCLGAALLLMAGLAGAAPLTGFPAHIPAQARSQALGSLPATNRLTVELSLPLRNREALTNLLRELYDPTSAGYHHYVTPEEFARRFGPTDADYQAAVDFARAHGLSIESTHPNRTLLYVRGMVPEIERAFHVNLRLYRHPTETRQFYAPDTEPQPDLGVQLLGIGGLDNYTLPRPMNLRADNFKPLANDGTNAAGATPLATGSGPRGNFLGKDFRAAYAPGVALTGAGQSVGLLEFDGYYPGDITTYEGLAGIAPVTLTNVLLDGATGTPGGNNLEVALDIDMAVAMAPGLSQVIVYEGHNGNDMLNRMATDNLAKQLSSSWTFGSSTDSARDQILMQFAAQGQTIFEASGDSGAYSAGNVAPADSPLVTSVGGTSLTTGANGAWVAESAWVNGGGGISKVFPIPVWQQGFSMAASHGSTSMRNVPDVAALADSVIWVVANNGDQGFVGGTSASAPLWAGFAALANQQAALSAKPAIGFINPALSAIAQGSGYNTAFHDITNGNNVTPSSSNLFFAVPGYDLCTGWGTPTGSNLIAALISPPDALVITPAISISSVGAVGGPFTPAAQNYSLLNFGSNALSWSLLNSTPWLTVSPTNGILPTNGTGTTVTFSLNNAASNLPAGAYTATVWFTNLNDSFAQERQFTLYVVTPPMITSQPSNQTVLPGSTALFTVGTASNAQLFFQWQKNGTNISDGGNLSGTATATLTIDQVSAADAATYSVLVSNALNTVTSSNAALTVQSVTAPGIIFNALYNFTGNNDGANPNGLLIGSNGNFFGTTQNGGAGQSGTVFQMPPTGAPATLYSFSGGADGGHPQAPLAQTADGGFYGTTFDGGDTDNGTIFKIATNGGFNRIVSLDVTNGDLPYAGLVRGSDGNFYGTTYQGGTSGRGTAYSLNTNGVQTILYSFSGGADGGSVRGGLMQAADGNFYGTTFKGGAANSGTLYKLTTNGVESVLVSFTGTNGNFPFAGVTQDEFGNIYGVTSQGGASNYGVIFKLSPSGALTNFHTFIGADGAQPTGGLIEGADGNFYGTTAFGGLYGNGTVFRLTPNGQLTTIAQFDGFNGANPSSTLVFAADGSLYGSTQNGGASGGGVIFKLSLNEGALQFTSQPVSQAVYSGSTVVLSASVTGTPPVSFQWTMNGTNLSDGANISGSHTRALTISNVSPLNAAIFAVTASNSFGPLTSSNAFLQVIASPPVFTAQPTNLTLSPGASAHFSAVVAGSQPIGLQWRKNGVPLVDGGNVSGSLTASLSLGTVTEADNGTYSLLASNSFSAVPSSDATLTVIPGSAAGTRFATLRSFAGSSDGSSPSVLTLATDGFLYGTTEFGGPQHRGTVFRVGTNGLVTNVANFTTNGSGPVAGVTQGLNGNFYGTTVFGGTFGAGSIFCMSTNGVITTLYSFTGGVDGNTPFAPLALGRDGNLYGSTEFGGNFANGNIFSITPTGVFSNVYSFTGGVDGGQPTNALMQASDGNFYGVTQYGGPQGFGTVFSIAPTGAFKTIFNFTSANKNNIGIYAKFPNGPLVQGDDGSLFGTTGNSALNSFQLAGTIFNLTTNGAYKILYALSTGDGQYPSAGLVQGADGNYYGTTLLGGSSGNGAVFRITPAGSISTLVSLDGFDEGAQPVTPVTVGADGNLYGTTHTGGPGGHGNIFRLSVTQALQILSQPAPQSAYVGSTATFGIGVFGSAPLSFQWQKDGANLTNGGGISGANSRLLTLGNLATNQAGNYLVIVSNSQGSVTSTPAALTLLSSGPIITSSPAPLNLLQGATATFNVSATGNQPLFYQWRKNLTNLSDGATITGSSSPTLIVKNVSPTDAGSYSAVVTNSLGSTNSGAAALTVAPSSAGANTLSTLYSFTGGYDGAQPNGLAPAPNGLLYGTARNGGQFGAGTIFQVNSNLAVSNLYTFTGGGDGANPQGVLTNGPNGLFYGTTYAGGSIQVGSIFTLTTNGVFSNLTSFGGGFEGAFPAAGLTLARDGYFYGTAFSGGSNNFGAIFRLANGNQLAGLYSFSGGTLDGGQPSSQLVSLFGDLYGVASVGGASNAGTFFKVTTNGTVTILHSFNPAIEGSAPNGLISLVGPDVPSALGLGVVPSSLYGTTSNGGTNGSGTVFRIDLSGNASVLYNFSALANSTNADGANPEAGLILGGDGAFYGTTANGGPYGLGTIFRVAVDPASTTFSVLGWFNNFNGAHPAAPLAQASDGYLYGTTSAGGQSGQGVIFRVGAAVSPILRANLFTSGNFSFTWSAIPGRQYQIQFNTTLASNNWQNFGGIIAATNSLMTSTDLATADQKRYYRVILLP